MYIYWVLRVGEYRMIATTRTVYIMGGTNLHKGMGFIPIANKHQSILKSRAHI